MTAAKKSSARRGRSTTPTTPATSDTNSPSAGWAKAIRRDRERTAKFLAEAPTCDVCGTRVSTMRKRHSICEPGTLAGKVCTCAPGCTTGATWGDGPQPCDPTCQPCRLMAGKRLPRA